VKDRKPRFPEPGEQSLDPRDDLSHGRNVIPLLLQVPAGRADCVIVSSQKQLSSFLSWVRGRRLKHHSSKCFGRKLVHTVLLHVDHHQRGCLRGQRGVEGEGVGGCGNLVGSGGAHTAGGLGGAGEGRRKGNIRKE